MYVLRIMDLPGSWVGSAMSTGLDRTESSRLSRAGPASRAAWSIAFFPLVLVAGIGTWLALSIYDSDTADGDPAWPAPQAAIEAAQSPASDDMQPGPSVATAAPPEQPGAAAEPLPAAGLKISAQSWRRGGLGSNAQVTFTLRNDNRYAVKDVEIACAFARRDGSHLTDRARVIPDTISMKSRKRFARLHVGFVNIHADRIKCQAVAANRV
jgi:hypothetical protein